MSTLPLTSDAVFAVGAKTVRLSGGAHLSVALALGAALPETKIGNVEAVDVHGDCWTSVVGNDPLINELQTERVKPKRPQTSGTGDRVAIFVTLAPDPDHTAFERLLEEATHGFAAAAVVSITGSDKIDSRESARLSAAIAQQIRKLAAITGRAEVHLAFHGPYTMAVLVGRHLNTVRTVVYEWNHATDGRTSYEPVLTLEPGITNGPIFEVHS